MDYVYLLCNSAFYRIKGRARGLCGEGAVCVCVCVVDERRKSSNETILRDHRLIFTNLFMSLFQLQ